MLLTNNLFPIDKFALKETSPAETTVPVNEGAARGALRANELVNAELTIDPPTNKLPLKEESDPPTDNFEFIETSPAETILPVNEGAARGALAFKDASNNVLTIFPPTNKLLVKETSDRTDNFEFMETSPADTIKPVNEGAAIVAFAFKDASNNVLTILPPTNNLLEKETSDKTDNLPFIETSPAEIIVPVNEGADNGALVLKEASK